MAHAGGRPTKYRPEFVQKIDEYLLTCGAANMRLPKRVDVALMLEVNEETLIEWGKKYAEFSDALDRVDHQQKVTLIDTGIFGGKEINASIIALMLKVNHGMIETNRTEFTGKDGAPLNLNVIAAAGYNHLSRPLSLDATSEGSSLRGQSPLQGLGVPQAGTENNDSDNRNDQTGTS